MILFQIPGWIRWFLPHVTWRRNAQEKKVYLTFDDGPIPEVTPQVLDLLDQYGAKATFFCVGENIQKHPEVFEELKRRGHAVGNHTYNHMQGLKHGHMSYLQNAAKAQELLHTRLFRPPHGRMKHSQSMVLRKNYEIVLWDVLTHDYNRHFSPKMILWATKHHTRNGSIVVFHDSLKAQQNMLPVLKEYLPWLQKQGYTFGMLCAPAKNLPPHPLN